MKKVNNIDELIKEIFLQEDGKELIPTVFDLSINFEISIPLDLSDYNVKSLGFSSSNAFIFNLCVFEEKVTFKSNEYKLYFLNCSFYETNWKNTTFEKKIRFHTCDFREDLILINTTFNGLADFWYTTFNKKVIFYKVDFNKTTVFSISTFNENVLFTYTKLAKQVIFRGTTLKKGIDLSLAIIEGNLAIFDFILTDYNSIHRKLSKLEYEDEVSSNGEIPIKNKRETYRIIKKNLIDQKNRIDASKYYYLENKTYWIELLYSILPSFNFKKKIKELNNWYLLKRKKKNILVIILYSIYHIINSLYKWLSKIANFFILTLNLLSNRYRTSFIFGIIFTLIVGSLFYYLSICNTSKYEFSNTIDLNIVKDNISNFAKFILPTHKFNYLGVPFINKYELYNMFYFWDIIGRIFVGYGVYQTIQAFRKFRIND